jgi:uncharacterized protein YbjT (DUF2867 family)
MKLAVAGGTGTVGQHVVAVAREAGHEVRILSRSKGVDLTAGEGLPGLLEGIDAVIDVTSTATQSDRRSREFFATVTGNLLAAGKTAAVPHHLALSIVGSARAPFGYYAGKKVQEDLVSSGSVPWRILRATQFHEFAHQIYGRFGLGPLHPVPAMVSQPVAAREVAQRLVSLAEGGPAGRPADLAGPDTLRMADMVRAYASALGRRGLILEFPLPGAFGRALRDGTLLAPVSADRGTQTYADWASRLGQASRAL